MKLTWKDVVKVHRQLQKELFTSERHIFEREAELLNALLKKQTGARVRIRKTKKQS